MDNPIEKKEISTENDSEDSSSTRRDFIVLTASAVACAGAAVSSIPFISSLNPDQAVLAVGSTEVDISKIKEGETLTVVWRGQPVFVRHRTSIEIKAAQEIDLKELRDPQPDSDRTKKGKEPWLICMAVCTHLGCVPLSGKGDFNGWFCPCHGSHYDTSGRIRKGPAPLNLPIPPYEFLSDNLIKIG